MKDLAYDLAGNIAAVKYEMLPEKVVDITKMFILDTLAILAAGSSAPGCKSVVEQMKDWGGKEESTILVYGGKIISSNAAFANSMMSHAVAFDAIHDQGAIHPNVSVVPAALAMAERVGTASGRDLITAVAASVDMMCRIGLARSEQPNWTLSSTAGYFGATAAAGKILGLDENKLLHALGIAYSQSAGNAQCVIERALVKRMQPAFATQAGILSSLLAEKGITGAKNIFEGQYGFFPLYHRNKYDRQQALKGLGEVFEIKNMSVELFPCCRYTHAPIEATLSIVKENNISPDDVEEVIAHVTQTACNLVGKPFEIRANPQVDAQYSIPYTVSVAIARRDISIDDFFEDTIKANTSLLFLIGCSLLARLANSLNAPAVTIFPSSLGELDCRPAVPFPWTSPFIAI